MRGTVLLIDDAQLERKINEWTLMQAGYDVLSAPNGEEALRLLHKQHPDVILLDSLLPQCTDRSLLAELKRNHISARVPIVVLASSGMDTRRFLREGASHVLQKEAALNNPGLLLDTVEGVLHPVL